jgi:hypothetical protein
MGTYIIMIAVLGVFAIRDSQLLAMGPADSAARRFVLYTSCLLVYVLTLEVVAFDGLGIRGVIAMLRIPAVWLTCIGIHLASWITCVRVKTRHSGGRAWTLALVPSPLLILAVLLLSTILTPLASTRHIQVAIFALFWSVGVAILAHWNAPAAPNWPLEFGGWANVLAIVLIPLDRIPAGVARCMDVLETYFRWD